MQANKSTKLKTIVVNMILIYKIQLKFNQIQTVILKLKTMKSINIHLIDCLIWSLYKIKEIILLMITSMKYPTNVSLKYYLNLNSKFFHYIILFSNL